MGERRASTPRCAAELLWPRPPAGVLSLPLPLPPILSLFLGTLVQATCFQSSAFVTVCDTLGNGPRCAGAWVLELAVSGSDVGLWVGVGSPQDSSLCVLLPVIQVFASHPHCPRQTERWATAISLRRSLVFVF